MRDRPLTPDAAVDIIEQLAATTLALEQAGVRGALPSPPTVLISGTPRTPKAQFAALEALLEAPRTNGGPGATAALGQMLAAMTTGGSEASSVPSSLRPVVERAARPGGYASPGEVAAAARVAVPRARAGRPRRALIAGAAVLAVAGAVAAAIASLAGDDPEATTAAAASAPAARIAATVDVGGVARAVAVGGDFAWVARDDHRLVRVDLRTNRVTGTPVAFGAKTAANSNSTVRAGAGAVWVMHASGREVWRIDPHSLRVTGRKRVRSPLFSAAVSGRELWTSTDSGRPSCSASTRAHCGRSGRRSGTWGYSRSTSKPSARLPMSATVRSDASCASTPRPEPRAPCGPAPR
jgi:hypothetical protein